MSKAGRTLVAVLAITFALVGAAPIAGAATPAKTAPRFVGTYDFFYNVGLGWPPTGVTGTVNADGTVTWTPPMGPNAATAWSNSGKTITIVTTSKPPAAPITITLTGTVSAHGFGNRKHPGVLMTNTAGIHGVWYAVKAH